MIIADTPNGFVASSPWATVDRALYVDLKCNLASIRSQRNVLSARNVMRGTGAVVEDKTFSLKQAAAAPFSEYEYQATPENVATVISSNRPVHVILTRASGTIDLGQITMLVLSSPIVSVKFVNDGNTGDAEINLIVI